MAAVRSFFVAGTDTDVGKTYIASMLIRQLRARGHDVVGMKPVASGVIEQNGRKINEDIQSLVKASGRRDPSDLINQYCYEPFVAPHIVAADRGERIELQNIKHAYEKLSRTAEAVVVEGAGGLMTPLNERETYLDLVSELQLPVILVVAVRLGCINHSLLTQAVLQQNNLKLAGWVANYPEVNANRDIPVEDSLRERLVAPCLGVIQYNGGDSLDLKEFIEA